MTTDAPVRTDEQGFTLIEVLFAMLILAVGLLGLEALGIGATRAVNVAGRQSTFSAMASDTLERTLGRIRRGEAVADGTTRYVAGSTQDSVRVAVGGSGTRLRDVTVTVVPNPSAKYLKRADSLRVSGYVFQ